jgi:hypothetical protein
MKDQPPPPSLAQLHRHAGSLRRHNRLESRVRPILSSGARCRVVVNLAQRAITVHHAFAKCSSRRCIAAHIKGAGRRRFAQKHSPDKEDDYEKPCVRPCGSVRSDWCCRFGQCLRCQELLRPAGPRVRRQLAVTTLRSPAARKKGARLKEGPFVGALMVGSSRVSESMFGVGRPTNAVSGRVRCPTSRPSVYEFTPCPSLAARHTQTFRSLASCTAYAAAISRLSL